MAPLCGLGNGMGKEPQHPPGTYLLMSYFACTAFDFAEMLGISFCPQNTRMGRLNFLWERKRALIYAIYL